MSHCSRRLVNVARNVKDDNVTLPMLNRMWAADLHLVHPLHAPGRDTRNETLWHNSAAREERIGNDVEVFDFATQFQMLNDLAATRCNPGYTAIGRMRGLAELRGLQTAILRARTDEGRKKMELK